jgi:hypothetical protein
MIPYKLKGSPGMPPPRPVGTHAFSLLPQQGTEIHTFHWADEVIAKEWFETLSEALEAFEYNQRVRQQSVASRSEASASTSPPGMGAQSPALANSLGSPSPPARHGRFFIPNTAPVPGGGTKMFTVCHLRRVHFSLTLISFLVHLCVRILCVCVCVCVCMCLFSLGVLFI